MAVTVRAVTLQVLAATLPYLKPYFLINSTLLNKRPIAISPHECNYHFKVKVSVSLPVVELSRARSTTCHWRDQQVSQAHFALCPPSTGAPPRTTFPCRRSYSPYLTAQRRLSLFHLMVGTLRGENGVSRQTSPDSDRRHSIIARVTSVFPLISFPCRTKPIMHVDASTLPFTLAFHLSCLLACQ